MDKCIFLYFCVVFSASIIITFSDKNRAKNGKKRIRERTLLAWGFFGGASVMYITMVLIRHKTRHLKFMILLPVFTTVHIIILYILFK